MFKKAGYVLAVCAIGILAMGWSQSQAPAAAHPARADLSPEGLMVGIGPLPVSKFNDMSFVFTDN